MNWTFAFLIEPDDHDGRKIDAFNHRRCLKKQGLRVVGYNS